MSRKGKVPLPEQLDLGLVGNGLRLPTREFSEIGKRKMEYVSLGFSPLAHPLEFFAHDGDAGDTPEAGRVRRRSGKPTAPSRVREPGHAGPPTSAVGLLAAMRHYKSNGTDLYFITLDHPGGLHECILPRRLRPTRLEIGYAYSVHGYTTTRFGVGTLRASTVKNLPEKASDVRFCLT
jgi:hypothetical protein